MDDLVLKWKQSMKEGREHEFVMSLSDEDRDFIYWLAAEEADAHSCVADADEFGHCRTCGAIVPGSYADHKEHGW